MPVVQKSHLILLAEAEREFGIIKTVFSVIRIMVKPLSCEDLMVSYM